MLARLPFPALLTSASLAGALAVLALAPFHAWPLQIAALAFLFAVVSREGSCRRAALIGWSFSFGWTVAAVYWLYVALHTYNGLPSWMTVIAVALLGLLMGTFTAIGTGCLAWLRKRLNTSESVTLLLVCPAFWTLSEWVRGWMFSGFPWASSGYAHTADPLAGFAPVMGVYGVGLAAAAIAGCVALLPARKTPLLLAAALFASGWLLQDVNWTTPVGKPISVRLLQGNVAQDEKFVPEHVNDSILLYYRMILEKPADLIATPETGMPEFLHLLPRDLIPNLKEFSQRTGSHVLMGVVINDKAQQYANSMVGISPDRQNLYRYDKHHLVPFGEVIPTGFRWFVDMMHIPLADQTPGDPLQPPFRVRDQWVQPNICYEDLFGEEIADQLRHAYSHGKPLASMLLNASNLAWYGETTAIPQHLQISRMRALETGRPMLRSTNNGATAVIGPKGEILAGLPFYRQGSLDTTVQGYQGLTPYILLGNVGPVLLALGLLAVAWLLNLKKR